MNAVHVTEKKMYRIYITRKIPGDAKKILRRFFEVDEFEKNEQISKQQLKKAVSEYDAILSMLSDPIDKDVLEHAEKLKVISNYAVGINNIDVDFAGSRGIAVYNTPDEVTKSTADFTFAVLLGLIRKVSQSQRFVKENKWKAYDPWLFLGEELEGKTFGIIGFGRIGKAVAKRALGFDLNVIYYDRSDFLNDPEIEGTVEYADFDFLLESSDYISLHIPLTEQTKGIININTIKKMKKKPVLINMARGAVVVTDDLVYALQNGLLRGAAVDVTDPEPIDGDHPLCNMENCIVVPHIGTSTIECRNKMAKKAADNIINHFKKENLI